MGKLALEYDLLSTLTMPNRLEKEKAGLCKEIDVYLESLQEWYQKFIDAAAKLQDSQLARSTCHSGQACS